MSNTVRVNGLRGMWHWLKPAMRHGWRVRWNSSVDPRDVVFVDIAGNVTEAPSWAREILRKHGYRRIDNLTASIVYEDPYLASKARNYKAQGIRIYWTRSLTLGRW